jgi:DNA-directed RNA polymerase subunit RPC12/RpoP
VKVIATYSKPEEAHLLRARLEAAGIPAFVRDENLVSMDWFYSNAIGGVRVEVQDEDEASAKEILELPQEESSLICPYCKSREIIIQSMSGVASFFLFLGLPLPFSRRKAECSKCKKDFQITRTGKTIEPSDSANPTSEPNN